MKTYNQKKYGGFKKKENIMGIFRNSHIWYTPSIPKTKNKMKWNTQNKNITHPFNK